MTPSTGGRASLNCLILKSTAGKGKSDTENQLEGERGLNYRSSGRPIGVPAPKPRRCNWGKTTQRRRLEVHERPNLKKSERSAKKHKRPWKALRKVRRNRLSHGFWEGVKQIRPNKYIKEDWDQPSGVCFGGRE